MERGERERERASESARERMRTSVCMFYNQNEIYVKTHQVREGNDHPHILQGSVLHFFCLHFILSPKTINLFPSF